MLCLGYNILLYNSLIHQSTWLHAHSARPVYTRIPNEPKLIVDVIEPPVPLVWPMLPTPEHITATDALHPVHHSLQCLALGSLPDTTHSTNPRARAQRQEEEHVRALEGDGSLAQPMVGIVPPIDGVRAPHVAGKRSAPEEQFWCSWRRGVGTV